MSAPAKSSSTDRSPMDPSRSWNVGAAICTWVVPGLGHWLLGERRRGVILCLTIGVLWLVGGIIGGVAVFDYHKRSENIVGYGQLFIAASVVLDHALRNWLHVKPPPQTPRQQNNEGGYEPSFARVNEQGILYTSLAGLLNLLVMLDVLGRDPTSKRMARDDRGLGVKRHKPATDQRT